MTSPDGDGAGGGNPDLRAESQSGQCLFSASTATTQEHDIYSGLLFHYPAFYEDSSLLEYSTCEIRSNIKQIYVYPSKYFWVVSRDTQICTINGIAGSLRSAEPSVPTQPVLQRSSRLIHHAPRQLHQDYITSEGFICYPLFAQCSANSYPLIIQHARFKSTSTSPTGNHGVLPSLPRPYLPYPQRRPPQ
jgi:hypothetical protein